MTEQDHLTISTLQAELDESIQMGRELNSEYELRLVEIDVLKSQAKIHDEASAAMVKSFQMMQAAFDTAGDVARALQEQVVHLEGMLSNTDG
jgi:predicted DNA-binding ribbon-helix-helix protein